MFTIKTRKQLNHIRQNKEEGYSRVPTIRYHVTQPKGPKGNGHMQAAERD